MRGQSVQRAAKSCNDYAAFKPELRVTLKTKVVYTFAFSKMAFTNLMCAMDVAAGGN